MTRITTRTLADRTAAIERMILALGRDTRSWDEYDLSNLSRLDVALAWTREQAVRALRDHGTTDKEIGEALGITQQAVSKRWPGGGRYVGAAGRYRQPQEKP